MYRQVVCSIKNFMKHERNCKYLLKLEYSGILNPARTLNTKALLLPTRYCSTTKLTEHVVDSVLDYAAYERVCSETMDGLNDYFEELLESADTLTGSDITYSDGVLTVKLGPEHGTYVINRQTPNRQIWLSSPVTGPKRYDFIGDRSAKTGKWIYRHNGESLHKLLQEELQPIFKKRKVEFENLPYGRCIKSM